MVKKIIQLEFFRYALVGTVGTLVDLGVLVGLVTFFEVSPHYSSLFYVFVSLAFIAAATTNFLLNQWWTFKMGKKRGQARRYVKYLIVSLIGLLLSNLFMYLFISFFLIWYVFAKLLTSLVVLSWNFVANKYWTFQVPELERIQKKKVTFPVEYSIVIPTYNEEKRIIMTLKKIRAFMKDFKKSYEIIIVDDGSQDNTLDRIWGYIDKFQIQQIHVLPLEKNAGKGAVVKHGVLQSKGRYILYTDADNSTPIEELQKFSRLQSKADILIGSRYLLDSSIEIRQPWYRIWISRLANKVIQFAMHDEIKDTQCGFKLFHHHVAKDIFQRVTVQRFGFDIEVLLLAKLLEYTMLEIPVSWYNSTESKVRPLKDAFHTFFDLVKIKMNVWMRKYEK